MTTATVEASGPVEYTHLADGLLVRLTGALAAQHVGALRVALLTPLPRACRDVMVDAGAVTDVSDEALAVLLAAPVWAVDNGARFALSNSSPALDGALAEAGADDLLPRLAPLG